VHIIELSVKYITYMLQSICIRILVLRNVRVFCSLFFCDFCTTWWREYNDRLPLPSVKTRPRIDPRSGTLNATYSRTHHTLEAGD